MHSAAVGPAQRSPRVYYLHPLLAGPIGGWPAHLDRVARLGFDHLLIAPPFLCGGAALQNQRDAVSWREAPSTIFLAADHDRLHPALAGPSEALAALSQVADEARGCGLVPLLDVVLDRVAAGSKLARQNPELFGAPDASDRLDPRRYTGDDEAAQAGLADPDQTEALAEWWSRRLNAWSEAGIGGFRFVPLQGIPPRLVRTLIGKVRRNATECLFLGWMPGVPQSDFSGFAGCGLDYVFSSLPWWDFSSDWLWQEASRLRAVAPILACPEAPFGRRIAATCHDRARLRAAYRRGLGFAAGIESGWMMPMGCEYAATRPMDPRRDTAEDFATLVAEAPFDLAETISAVNRARAEEPALAGSAEPRLLTGAGGPIIAVLRPDGADARAAERAVLVLANAGLEQRVEVPTASLLANAGGSFVPIAPGAELAVEPGDVLTVRATAAPPILRPRDDLAASAREAAKAPRLAIEAVSPSVDGGQFPARRCVGELVEVSTDVICEGHDQLGVVLMWRTAEADCEASDGKAGEWHEVRMLPLGNDRWTASFPLLRLGMHEFTIEAWRDAFASFRDELSKKHAAGVNIKLELVEGRELIADIARHAAPKLKPGLDTLLEALSEESEEARRTTLLAPETAALLAEADPRPFALRVEPPFPLEAERTAARFASWYEIFPRSMSDDPHRHGTFEDVIRHLPRIRDMGFDVLYFPPIHPIGRTNRKGRNNSLTPAPDDPGSPYAIGNAEGGHDALHPELGTIEDFRRLRQTASRHGLELALDFAIQCSPDHPWLRQHKEWFDWRPDGSLRYAENPPKKYEDIVNVDFYAPGAIPGLWQALCEVVLFWAGEGVRIFRVDNPHTKPLPFWHWMIAEVKARYPDTIFFAEAFTKPKMMYRLAKVGFSESYTYFTWRNTKQELTEYLEELANTAPREFFRPNFFVNTPDINPVFLQTSGRPGFLIRAALATTLSGLWGLYNGFELCEGRPLPGREEYIDSEKYQLRAWDWDRPGNIVAEITSLNWIRRTNPALQTHLGVTFLPSGNDHILFYEKSTPDRGNVVLVAVGLDPRAIQETEIELPLWRWRLPDDGALQADDLVGGTRFVWHGKRQRLRLDPFVSPYAIWRVRPAA
ncbi:MAG: alpha-1,4-glucan--maltose-1-phosphate maltosyltransferase [Acidisphaera sp.]|nr:alpha-1,4-glucan--maltose-1-phosphate maltosyltransferase [Acidisphaera sp.]